MVIGNTSDRVTSPASIQRKQFELYTVKREKKIFFIYEEIQMGPGAKSYMTKGFLIYEEMRKY